MGHYRSPVDAKPVVIVASLQSGLPDAQRREFELELRGCFQGLKWLIKEFRLHVGYETPDEEAGIRFWIDRYERQKDPRTPVQDMGEQGFPTADEPAMPATQEEVMQARRWPRKHVEWGVGRLFELRRLLCPQSPILVPLHQLKHYEMPRSCSAKQRGASLHQFRHAAHPQKLVVSGDRAAKRAASRAATLAEARSALRSRQAQAAANQAQPLPKEPQDRLFPASAVASHQLSDDQFASRVIDLAIEFDGDPQRASRDGPQLLANGVTPGALTPRERKWHEGRSRLEDLFLVQFWLRLGDQASLGLMMPLARAEKVLSERERGSSFADAVLSIFSNRFKYECLDAALLYRFWLSMPKAVRSCHHVRGLPERQAFELLREGVRLRLELVRTAKAQGTAVPPLSTAAAQLAAARDKAAAASKPWRPSGEAVDQKAALDVAQLQLARQAVMPFGTPPRRGLEELARPKMQGGALHYLKVLKRQFPTDPVLRRMIRQCLDCSRSWWESSGPADFETYQFFMQEGDVENKIEGKPSANSVKGELLKQGGEKSLQIWMETDTERARQTLEALTSAKETTRHINRKIQQAARSFIKKGARLGPFGAYFAAMRHRKEPCKELRGLALADDLFAELCRQLGTWEVIARFGADYLPTHKGAMPGGFLMPGFPAVAGRGGPTVDCSTRRAVCKAKSEDYGCSAEKAVDGEADTGWRPAAGELGGAALTIDLGRLQSCVGIVLNWVLPRRKEVVYTSHLQLAADIALQGGLGNRIVVARVSAAGAAAAAGVTAGDVLQLGVGGDGDKFFVQLPPAEALLRLQVDPVFRSQPVKLVFEGVEKKANKVPVPVKVLVAKCDKEPLFPDYDTVKEMEVKAGPGEASEVAVVFVGRWVQLQFEKAWPKTKDGQIFKLSVSVQKVWRLAPAAFRQRLVDALRHHANKQEASSGSAAAGINAIFRGRIWAPSTAKKTTHNRKIMQMIDARRVKSHDFENVDEELFENIQEYTLRRQQIPGRPKDKEFNIEQVKESKIWRPKIYAMEDDIRECTFHPRAAGNVPLHIRKARHKVGETFSRQDEPTSIADHVKDLGENFTSQKYQNYHIVRRRQSLTRAKRSFAQGHIIGALQKLQTEFGVNQIMKRFRCFHKGCGRLLTETAEMCACSGFYCANHVDTKVHNCKEQKLILLKEADAQRKRDQAMKANGETPQPEEKFDDKVELGLLLEVLHLAEAIFRQKKEKMKQKRAIERIEQSVAQFGTVGIAERPFKEKMCSTVLENRRSWPQLGGANVPLFSPPGPPEDASCGCADAHHVSELRFAAGESATRATDWLQQGLVAHGHAQDVVTGSLAYKKLPPKPPGPIRRRRSASLGQRKLRRSRSAQHHPLVDARLEEGMHELRHAAELLREAKAQFREGSAEAALRTSTEVKSLARRHTRDAALAASIVRGDETVLKELPPEAAASQVPDLRSQIRALAGIDGGAAAAVSARPLSSSPRPSPPRSPRRDFGGRMSDGERQQLLHRGVSNVSEARDVLEQCRELEAEVKFSEALRKSEEADMLESLSLMTPLQSALSLPVGSRSAVEELGGSASALGGGAASPVPRALGRKEMCADFLDSGSCIRGNACPYAHRPGELSSRSEVSLHSLARSARAFP
eukprot:TRINITY_DN27659_c0_g2_i1.p1 TRINITY_DN27659_c0_g2~~TRINITY_DN27659_c0_g2_i1.p1  ORF type:complete len:1634 (-),score=460.19 TRINITY_DN27659_c0_g2_i1:336-5237(-)